MKAIWLNDDEELFLVEPVVAIADFEDIRSVKINNGYNWYNADDCEYASGQKPNKIMLIE